MTKQKYVLSLVLLLIGINSFGAYADEYNKVAKISQSNDELIKKLPTALLENLKRDLQTREEKENKVIDNIAGISKDRLESEIINRNSEDRSKTIGTRSIDPKVLPGSLLKYIADHGVSYEGCSTQDAINEIQNRVGVAGDLPSILTASLQTKQTYDEQQKSAEEFAKREDAEDLSETLDNIKEDIEKGKDPSITQQTEFIKKKEETAESATGDALQKAINKEPDISAPHGYDEKAQSNRTPDEIESTQQEVEKRGIVNNEESEDKSLWQKLKKTVNGWFNENEISSSVNTQKDIINNELNSDEVTEDLSSVLTSTVEDAA